MMLYNSNSVEVTRDVLGLIFTVLFILTFLFSNFLRPNTKCFSGIIYGVIFGVDSLDGPKLKMKTYSICVYRCWKGFWKERIK